MLTLYLLTTLLSPVLSFSVSNALSGTCASAAFPTEEQYTAGYEGFCNTYMPFDGYYPLIADQPIVATFNLTQADGGPVQWVYKIEITWARGAENKVPTYPLGKVVNKLICIDRFKALLDSEEASGSGFAYCVVEGTGGDKGKIAQTGNGGTVCVLGGETTLQVTPYGYGQKIIVHFMSYRKKGT
jgi:hypothetical protein